MAAATAGFLVIVLTRGFSCRIYCKVISAQITVTALKAWHSL